ncbi:MAG: bifunctional diaminohydroxyphosphoribosylaminopyrimidine deaminase/5-amino-6-(5-phosphoribosylamino)uracil reductase RibD [Candidatus Azobacteroides sp.]|nr:bifunctional diaminohydroxyphosphoribosylaminopyrimidine deaminase/5-amino-6-(5-phosphoribosylamino)uracil reductase RibD [Candidatus Azobacteroides sp.]
MFDEKYMKRCLQLAVNGRSNAIPNPVVGAVIVYEDKIIGEGFHSVSGRAHAEVNAVASVKKRELLKDSTLYVSLEPCSHYGKTPPCAELIIRKQIPRVVIGIQDPFAEVAGRGIRMLRESGVQVSVGVLEEECRKINNRFITFHTGQRPYVVLKWAQTKDGYIDVIRDYEKEPAAVISNEITQIKLHKFRSQVGGIMVGTNTAIKDNPSLTVRLWEGRNPVRIFIDRQLRVPEQAALLNGETETIVFTAKNDTPVRKNVEYVCLDFSRNIIPQILCELYKRNIQSLLVEGGRTLLEAFIDAGIWDEARIEIAGKTFGGGIQAPVLYGEVMSIEKYGDSSLVSIKNNGFPMKSSSQYRSISNFS